MQEVDRMQFSKFSNEAETASGNHNISLHEIVEMRREEWYFPWQSIAILKKD